MRYKALGTTGIQASVLGFGCMRFPMTTAHRNGEEHQVVDDEKTAPLLLEAVRLGINFFDTHWFYCNFDSQRALGAALKPVRDKIYLSSKISLNLVEQPDDFDRILERALALMDTDYVDFYHFPAMSYHTWQNKILSLKLIDRAEKAKSKGLLRHLSFSYHSDPDKMPELLDTGAFSTVLGQYNFIDRRAESVFAHAKQKGVGTMVMGPLMGGVLADGGADLLERMHSTAESAAEMALQFAWGNPDVDVVLSGMSTPEQLAVNARYAAKPVDPRDRAALIERSRQLDELKDLYCTNCNYCHTCPEGIAIGRAFTRYLRHKTWGLDHSGGWWQGRRGGKDPSECTGCGVCLSACPQKIDIPNELKRVRAYFENEAR